MIQPLNESLIWLPQAAMASFNDESTKFQLLETEYTQTIFILKRALWHKVSTLFSSSFRKSNTHQLVFKVSKMLSLP